MFKYTNKNNISLPLSVFMMYDDYDYDNRKNVISATSIIRPIRQLVLARQYPDTAKEVDVLDLVSSRMGSAIHDGCERAWNSPKNVSQALTSLNMSKVAERMKINPDTVSEDDIPVYVEQRHEKEINGFIISGKYDLILNGRLSDYKSTSVWTYIYDSNALKYTQQGSIYKWLAPDRITDHHMDIQFIFTDWSSSKATQDTSYPQMRVATKSYPLWSTNKTEEYIKKKLTQLTELIDAPQFALPECTDDELWATDPKWKYYKNPQKMSRATRVFNNAAEADVRLADDGGVGVVVEHKGQVKACQYCSVVGVCEQANRLLNEGRLLL